MYDRPTALLRADSENNPRRRSSHPIFNSLDQRCFERCSNRHRLLIVRTREYRRTYRQKVSEGTNLRVQFVNELAAASDAHKFAR
jgi:hypothetical protein